MQQMTQIPQMQQQQKPQNTASAGVDSVASFLLGLENLMENRQQTADNDVSKANETQAEFLLTELNKKFDEQNKMLNEILEELHKNENTDGRNE